MIIDELLGTEPYFLSQSEKKPRFLQSMKESFQWHYQNCEMFQRFIDAQPVQNLSSAEKIEELPYLPITIFKELDLVSGPREQIKGTIRSSGTTSGKKSVINLDAVTMKRQQQALQQIMGSYLGKKRRIFIVFDSPRTVQKDGQNIPSRASAIRGMSLFARSMKFVLTDNLELDPEKLEDALSSLQPEDEVCIFGFTWILYKTFLSLKERPDLLQNFKEKIKKLSSNKKILHIGGWKKLKDIQVDKSQFNQEIADLFNTSPRDIIDFYGMTEQLGTVYPDCEEGYKHLPLYSEIILRDINTFEPLPIQKPGFIQLLTPLPNSYPGISILTEDVGEIKGIDDCPCGRKGKYFVFRKRIETAPIKGCGDTL